MKKILLRAASVMMAVATPLAAQAGDVSVSTSIDLVSDYVFRGISLADTAIQPGVEVSIGDFTVGAWASTGLGDTSILAGDELDLYAGYSFGLSETISADVGITYYHYPQGGGLFATNGGGAGTYEVYTSFGFDTALAPSITGYYDFTLKAFTVEGGVEHSVPVGEKTSLDLGATVGSVFLDGGGDYQYGQASASFGYAFTDDVSAYIGANLALSSEDTLGYEKIINNALMTPPVLGGSSSLLFFGAGVAAGF